MTISRKHALRRTSPKGGPFYGVCTQCGQSGLSLADMATEECPNQRSVTRDEALIEAILGDEPNRPSPFLQRR